MTTSVETQLSGADQFWRDKSKGGKSLRYVSLDAEPVPGPLSSGWPRTGDLTSLSLSFQVCSGALLCTFR